MRVTKPLYQRINGRCRPVNLRVDSLYWEKYFLKTAECVAHVVRKLFYVLVRLLFGFPEILHCSSNILCFCLVVVQITALDQQVALPSVDGVTPTIASY